MPPLFQTLHTGKNGLFVGCKKAYLMYRPGEGGTAASAAGPPPVEVAAPGPASTPSIGITSTPFTSPTLSNGSGRALNGNGCGGSQAGSSASLTGLDPATTTTAAALASSGVGHVAYLAVRLEAVFRLAGGAGAGQEWQGRGVPLQVGA